MTKSTCDQWLYLRTLAARLVKDSEINISESSTNLAASVRMYVDITTDHESS